jgi:hypothetical protein
MILGITAAQRQFSIETPPVDPDWASVTLLTRFDDADGSTLFLDEKQSPVSRTGSVEIDTAFAKFGPSSALFSGGHLSCAQGELWNGYGAANLWTGELFCRVASGPTNWTYGLLTLTQTGSGLQAGVHIQESGGTRYIYVYRQGETNGYFGTITFPLNQFNYVKVVNTGSGAPICYVNGVSVTLSSFNYSSRIRPTVAGLMIGAISNSTGEPGLKLLGHLDEIRITKGVARTSSYAVPTSQFPNT